ncbi:MAG: hypothetical protein PUD31_02795 [Solobacterium sp.]|nr:hypothetical protein [Solobacterium sp.]
MALDQKILRKAQGAFLLAQKMGLLEDASFEALEKRRYEYNNSEHEYGPHYLSKEAYLFYELTRLKLDFVLPTDVVKKTGLCPNFTEEQRKEFYEKNHDLFGRYHGDFFTFEEVSQIIEKRLREEAYDKLIEDILR